MKTVLELLAAGRDLISDPERWTTSFMGRAEDGARVNPADERACSWCAMGALVRIVDRDPEPIPAERARIEAMDLLNAAAYEVEPDAVQPIDHLLRLRHIAYLNDGPDGHARVLRAYDIAIERARAKEAGG